MNSRVASFLFFLAKKVCHCFSSVFKSAKSSIPILIVKSTTLSARKENILGKES